jgi:Skp family chaperone for outer membrane proteins
VLTLKEQRELEKLRAQDQREIKRLQKELRKKEKALAEAAALLLVTKKMQALWGEAEED